MSYRCDHCGGGISGIRWRCQGGCNNYDLCGRCHNNPSGVWKGNHTRRHLEVAYFEPGGSAASFYCNTCGGTIANRRWACQQCVEYDLCDACHSRGMGFAAPHNASHDMSLFLEPGCRPAEFHCDNCRTTISGVRYHCLSGCNDFDLCQSCFNMRPNVGMHNSTHTMKAVSEPGSFPINVIPGGGYPSPSPFPVAAPASAAPSVSVGFNPTGISINISAGPAVPPPHMSVGIAPQTSPYGPTIGVAPPSPAYPGTFNPAPPPPSSSMGFNNPSTMYSPNYAPNNNNIGVRGGAATVTSYGPTQPSAPGFNPAPPAFGSAPAVGYNPPSNMYPSYPSAGGSATITSMGPTQPSYPPQPTGYAGYPQPGAATVTSMGPTQPYNSFISNPPPPGSAVITSRGPSNPPSTF